MPASKSKIVEEKELPPLATGIPPWHAFAFLTIVLAICIPFLPSLEEIDALSQPDIWTARKFPDLISLQALAILRLSIAGIALGLTFYLAVICEGWDVFPNYKPHSKLRRVFLRLQGFGTLCPFTSWCWIILGLGFLTRGIIALAASHSEPAGDDDESSPPAWASSVLGNKHLLRATLVLWELTGPFAILVSSVVTYVIWPEVEKGGKPHNLAGVRNQLQHNCNTIFSLLEVTLLGGMPVEFSHLSLAATVGLLYILFTWIMAKLYFGNATTVVPQYIYWFMDTTLEQTTTIAIVVLTLALTSFFALFSVVVRTVLGGGGDESSSAPPSLVLNLAFLVVGTYLVCKFKK